jgi:hypothetical protein
MLRNMIEGVTTAIVGFIFVCIVYPRMVKNTTQFYAAIALVVVMLLLGSLTGIITAEGFYRFVRGFCGLLQVVAFILLILATGGLSLKELTGEFRNAFEVIRRGESEKEVIIPLSNQDPKPRRKPVAVEDDDDEDDGPTVHVITPPPPTPPPGANPTVAREPDRGAIPMD